MSTAKDKDASPDQDATHTDAVETSELEAIEAEAVLSEAKNITKNHVIAAMAVGLVPIPVFDLVALLAIELKMLHSLADHYEVPFSQHLGKSLIVSLVGGVLPASITFTASSMLKWIPGVGSLAGGASVAILSGAVTYAVGKVFIQHFESGGNLLDFNPEHMRELFRQELEEGKEAARDLKDKAESAVNQGQ